MTTTGWTLHDDQSADPQPYFVFKSHGESGAEDAYLQFRISTTSGRIHVAAFQYWDAATHTAVTPNTISVETLVRDFASGAKIGEDQQPVINSYYNAPGTFYAVNKFDGWTSVSGQQGRCGAANGGLQGDPGRATGRHAPDPVRGAHRSRPRNSDLKENSNGTGTHR